MNLRDSIRICTKNDIESVFAVINDAAQAYKGVIPADCWHEPYMSLDYLRNEIEAGITFWGCDRDGEIIGVMGIQDVQDVTLIRHAYVKTTERGKGIGGKLITHLLSLVKRPALVGTWAAAVWAVRFYENHGFRLVTWDQKEHLLRKYWSIPERQIETSVVLADERWYKNHTS